LGVSVGVGVEFFEVVFGLGLRPTIWLDIITRQTSKIKIFLIILFPVKQLNIIIKKIENI
jgi:hypothetical protein